MRAFWIIVGILVIGVAVIAFREKGDGQRESGAAGNPTSDARSSPVVRLEASELKPQDSGLATTVATTAAPPDGRASTALRGDGSAPAEALVDDLVDDLLSGSTADVDTDTDLNVALATNAAPAGGMPEFDPEKPIDGKYIVSGSGTADDPYQITWDLLLLTAQTYQPRLGSTAIPPQVQAVDGAHVKIAGYFAVPMASTDAREVLVMLNMWDGCCIGLPPSPCDAIEVRLKEPLPGSGKQYINYGTLTGTLQVDPFVQNGWLLGMYLVEDGELEVGM